MKKILLSFAFYSCSFICDAQLTKSYWLVGGNGTISRQHQRLVGSDVKSTMIQLNPNLGYFIVDKFALGLKPGFGYSNIKKGNVTLDEGTSWTVGPYARYYFLPTENATNIFAETAYKYTWLKDDSNNLLLFSGGPAFFFNTSVALELTANYTIFKFRKVESSAKTFFIAIGLQVHLENDKQ